MSSQQFHPKNPYFNNPPDFAALRAQYPHLLQDVISVNPYLPVGQQLKIDWTDRRTLQALTKALLLHDFKIEWSGLDGYLCPPLPNRLNYLCWMSDLVQSCMGLWPNGANSVQVIDVGVGANTIYPLLGTKMYGWHFAGTDINVEALAHAQAIVTSNPELCGKIQLLHVPDSSQVQTCVSNHLSVAYQLRPSSEDVEDIGLPARTSLLQAIYGSTRQHAGTRGPIRQAWAGLGELYRNRLADCEFYCAEAMHGLGSRRESGEEQRRSKKSRSRTDDADGDERTAGDDTGHADSGQSQQCAPIYVPLIMSVMTNPPFYDLNEQVQAMDDEGNMAGCRDEMHTLGGELAFVASMIADSLVLRSSVLWYTAMVGKKASLSLLRSLLAVEGVPKDHVICTTFQQGVTHRWGIAWTFHPAAARLYHTCSMLLAPPPAAAVRDAGTEGVVPRKAVDTAPVMSASLSFAVAHLLATALPAETSASGLFPAELAVSRVQDVARQVEGSLRGQHYSHDYVPHSSTTSLLTTAGVVNAQPWQISVDVTSPVGMAASLEFFAQLDSLVLASVQGGGGRQMLFRVEMTVAECEGTVALQLMLKDLSCPEAFASRIFSRVKEFVEPEVLRVNRKWRRLLQRQAQAAGAMEES